MHYFFFKQLIPEKNSLQKSSESGNLRSPMLSTSYMGLRALFTFSVRFCLPANRPSAVTFSSSIAPLALDSSKVSPSGAFRLSKILTEKVNRAWLAKLSDKKDLGYQLFHEENFFREVLFSKSNFLHKLSTVFFVISLFFLFFPALLFCTTWSSPVDLSAAGQDASEAQVAMNDSGEAIVIWVRNNIIQASTQTFGGSWSAPVDLSPLGDFSSAPQVCINASGQAIAIWRRKSGTNYDIQTAAFTFGGSWSAPNSLFALANDALTPQIVMNASGQVVAVWSRNDGTNYIVELATLTFGGSWSTPVSLSALGANGSNPHIAMNDSGQMVVVWIRNDVVQADSAFFGGVWAGSVNLSKKPLVSSPFVLIDPYGNVRASWRRTLGEYTIYEMGSLTFGGNWTTPIYLAKSQKTFDYVQIGFNQLGGAVIVWYKTDGTNDLIKALTYDKMAWSSMAILSDAGQDATDPHAVLNNAGQIVAIWLRSNGNNIIVQASIKTI